MPRRSTDVARSQRAKQANHDAARIAISAAWTAAWLARTAKYCASITVKAAPHSRLHKVVEAAYTLHAMGQAWQMVAAKMPTPAPQHANTSAADVDSGAGQAETNPPAKTKTTPPFFTSAGGFWCVMRRSTIQFVGYEPRPSLGPGAQLGNPRAEPMIPVG